MDKKKKAPRIMCSYDSEVSELTVYFPHGVYVYRNLSPYHVKVFKRYRNVGNAMAWLKKMDFEFYKK